MHSSAAAKKRSVPFGADKIPTDPVERAQLVAALWLRPIASDAEAAIMVGLPRSTWAALKRSAGFPAQFSLGRRVFFRVDDLRAWLNGKAAAAS